VNPLDASTETLLRERLATSERLLEAALAGQRDLGRLLEEQAVQYREVLELPFRGSATAE